MTPARREVRRRMLVLAERLGPQKSILEVGIAGDDPPGANREFFKAESYETLDKDEKLKPDYVVDLENDIPDSLLYKFDLVIVSQVLEHCWRFHQVMTNLWFLVDPSGRLIIDTPLMYPPHGADDYWRFTPEGLKRLCQVAGFTVEDIVSPGDLIVSALCRKNRYEE